MTKLVTSSIVLYKNDKKVLLKTINSFLNTNLSVKLYLIDNSPTDDLKVLVIDQRIEYYHNSMNLGFGAAHNIALKKSFLLDSKYHLVLNPDVYFDVNTIEAIIAYMDNNYKIGNLMPNVIYPDGSLQRLCKLLPTPYDWIGRRFNPFQILVEKRNEIFELRFSGYDKIMEVPYLSGCFMFLRMDAIREIGFFDESIFMYGEDTDLCRRLIAKNFKTVFYPKVTITHEFEKGSHKSWYLTWVGIKSAIYYFNKWGWIFDKQRKVINIETLRKLSYK